MVNGRRLTVCLAVLAVLTAMCAVYVAGYLWLGERSLVREAIGFSGRQPVIVLQLERTYPHQWQVILFTPAARIDGLLRDRPVEIRQKHEWPEGEQGVVTVADQERRSALERRLNDEIRQLPELDIFPGRQSVRD